MRIYKGKLLCDGCGGEVRIPKSLTIDEFNEWAKTFAQNHDKCKAFPQDYFTRNSGYHGLKVAIYEL